MRILVLILALFTALPASALSEADRSAMRGVIDRQIDAFRRDDAEAAFGFAAPTLRSMFPASDRFMSMVRQSYAPVYRPRSYAFAEARDLGASATQLVKIIDEKGGVWSALYSFERQPDGTWRISGCQLLKDPEQAA